MPYGVRGRGAAAIVVSLCFCAGSLSAQGQSGRQKDDEGQGDIYVHGKNPHEAGAPFVVGGEGLTTEVERESAADVAAITPPPWAGVEVTDDPAYSGWARAQRSAGPLT